MKIATHKPRVPWSWVAMMGMPWAASVYVELSSGAPLTFTLRRFVDEPVLISFLSSINIAFNFLVGALTSYLSDRIWTRWGRRRPFLIVGRLGTAVCLILVPLMPNLWTLAVVIVIYQFCNDFGTPYEPLYNEVIPPSQRGRAATIRMIMQSLMVVFFNAVLIARFDKQYHLASLTIAGERMVYWLGSVIVFGVVLFLVFVVKETPPLHAIRTDRFTVSGFFRDVFGERQAWMIYLLYTCPALAGAGMGTLLPLFQTEQLGFTKEQIGYAGAIGTPFNVLLFLPLAGILADRWPRIRMFRLGLFLPIIVSLLFWLYVKHVAHYRISLATLIGFGLVSGFFAAWMHTVWGPLIYDYMPSDKFGTYSAGFCFVNGVLGFALINLTGLWVRWSTRLFGSAGGSAYDYSSIYPLSFFFGTLALCITFYFQRQVKRGRVVPFGQLELKEEREREKDRTDDTVSA